MTKQTISVNNHTYRINHATKNINGHQYCYLRTRFIIDEDPVSGKRKEAEVTAETIEELRQKLEEKTMPLKYRLNPIGEEMTLKQYLSQWYENAKISWKPTTRQAYRSLIQFISRNIGNIILRQIHENMIQMWYNNLQSAGFSASQIHRINTVFSCALNDACLRKYIAYNPCKRIHLPKIIHSRVAILSLEEQRRFLREAEHSCHKAVLAIALLTGMRIGEVLGLCWEQIDFEKNRITVDRQLIRYADEEGQYVEEIQKSTKTGGIRYVHTNEAAESYLKEEREKYDFVAPDSLVFKDRSGNHISYRNVKRSFQKICRKLNLSAHLHTLRHTAASNLYHASKDMRYVQEQLGHVDERTTYYYTHTRAEDLRYYIDRESKDMRAVLPESRIKRIEELHKSN